MGLRSCALLGKSCQPLESCAPPRVLGDDELPCLQSHTFALARVVAILASCRRVADQHLPPSIQPGLLTSISSHYPYSSSKSPGRGLALSF